MDAERAEAEQAEAIRLAIQGSLPDGELVVSWVLVAEVDHGAGRYLAHRAGDLNGDGVMAWTALGMLQAGVRVAEQQVAENTADPDDD